MGNTVDIAKENRQLAAAAKALDTVLASSGPADLCRKIVHSDFVPPSTRGCEIFYLDAKSAIRSVAGYGKNAINKQDLSAWDDSPLSKAIREKRATSGTVTDDSGSLRVIVVPFVALGVPVGLLALSLDDLSFEPSFSPEIDGVISKLGAFYLDTLDFGNVSNGTGSIGVTPEDLTTRQLSILGHIENGLVNLEIAKILMLSESTIRQETVRIYRALGVGNRQEAVKKAKALGLLAKRVSSLES